MKIKSYFSRTVEDAVAAARQELGPEAMLVQSRKTPLESRHLGAYEVVFASELPPAGGLEAAVPVASPGPGYDERLSGQVAELRRELEGMRRTLVETTFRRSEWTQAAPGAAEAYAMLSANDVPADLAAAIVDGAQARLTKALQAGALQPEAVEPGGFAGALAQEITGRCAVEPTLGCGEATPRIVALVGPPGAGKTTTLVKLAVNYGLAGRRPVVLLSMDTYRVAAAEQLRAYAAILGVGFQVTETVTALAQAIEENRGKELLLIDTAGLGAGDLDDAGPLARFLSTRHDIDTHLVLSGSTKPADLTRQVNAFSIFRRRLLFTRLDETSSFGPLFHQAARTALPLSFFGVGQRIPEDLEAATQERVLELVVSPASRMQPAA